MADNGSNAIHGDLLQHASHNPNDRITTMCNGNGSVDHKFIKEETSSYCSEESADSPLDYSFKRRNGEVEASSTGSPHSASSIHGIGSGSYGDDRKSSDEEGSGYNGVSKNGNSNREHSSNEAFQSGLAGMVQAFQSGTLPAATAASICGSLPAMAALMDPRITSQASSKSSRPFKAYPKEPLSMPLGCYGVSGMNPFQAIESNMLQNLNPSGEDLMNLYKQQLRALHEQNPESHKSSLKSSTVPSASATSSNTGTSPLSHSHQHNSLSAPATPSGHCFGRLHGTQIPGTSGMISPNVNSNRKRARTLPDEQKDEAYWERRRKNNEAAKRSRDARRAKEDEIAIRAALLEQENLKLRVEVAALKTETAKLRCMLYNT